MLLSQQHSDNLNEVLASASLTGVLTIADRYVLQTAILDESLDPQSKQVVNRLLHSVRRGWVKVYGLQKQVIA